jgi:hypothetical protein
MNLYKKALLAVGVLATMSAQAQTTAPCNDLQISTDPSNSYGLPQAAISGNTLRLLDWLQSSWDWQTQSTAPSTIIQNPFTASGNPNLQTIINNNPDNLPEDGWEILAYNDGSKYDGLYQWRQSDYDFPYLILYNKYHATIRVFVYYNLSNANQDYDYATISLLYIANDVDLTSQPALLSNYAQIQKPVDAFNKKTHAQVANTVSLNNYQWLYGDFPVAYDPCVCDYTYSKMRIMVSLVDDANVKLSGITNTLTAANKNGTTITPGLGLAGGSEIGKDLTKALKVFKDDKDLLTSTIALLGTQAKGADKADSAKKMVNGSLVAKQLFEILKVGSSSLPYFGLIFSLADNLVADSKPAGPTQVAFSAKTDLNGTIPYNQNGAINAFFKVPGSLAPAGLLDEEKPLYDEPLGVFNLLNTAELEFVDYYTHYDAFGHFAGFNGTVNGSGNLANDFHPFIRQYRIKTVPKIVINPSAELELVDLRYTLRVGYRAHPTDKNTIFDQSFNTMTCWLANDGFNLSNNSAINMQNFYDYPGFFVHDINSSTLNSPHFVTVKPFPIVDFNIAGNGNFQGYNTNIDNKMKKVGLAYENWPKTMPYADPIANVRGYINTNYLPYEWMPYQTFYSFSGMMVTEAPQCGSTAHGVSEGGKPIFELKVQATFKRKNDPEEELIVHTSTFPINVVESPENKTADMLPRHTCDLNLNTTSGGFDFALNANGVASTRMWADPLRIPFDIKFENETVGPGDISAIHNIVFGNNVTVLPNTNFYAGNLISIEGTATEIPAAAILEIRPIPNGVQPILASDYLAVDVTDACHNKLTYNPVVEGSRLSVPSTSYQNPLLIKVFPNPTTHYFSIQASQANQKLIGDVYVYDISHKQVAKYTGYQEKFALGDLAPGMYFIEILTMDKKSFYSTKLMVSR